MLPPFIFLGVSPSSHKLNFSIAPKIVNFNSAFAKIQTFALFIFTTKICVKRPRAKTARGRFQGLLGGGRREGARTRRVFDAALFLGRIPLLLESSGERAPPDGGSREGCEQEQVYRGSVGRLPRRLGVHRKHKKRCRVLNLNTAQNLCERTPPHSSALAKARRTGYNKLVVQLKTAVLSAILTRTGLPGAADIRRPAASYVSIFHFTSDFPKLQGFFDGRSAPPSAPEGRGAVFRSSRRYPPAPGRCAFGPPWYPRRCGACS